MRGRITVSRERKERWAASVKASFDAARSRGIQYVAVIAPNKSSGYPEHLPAWEQRRVGQTATDQMLDHLRDRQPEIPIVDLRPALSSAKHLGRLYMKTDVHWTTISGWVATRSILDAARPLLANVREMRPSSDYRVLPNRSIGGDLTARLNLRPFIRDLDFATEPVGELGFVATPDSPYMKLPVVDGDHPTFTYRAPDRSLPRVLVFRNSFFNALLRFFPAYFSETVNTMAGLRRTFSRHRQAGSGG